MTLCPFEPVGFKDSLSRQSSSVGKNKEMARAMLGVHIRKEDDLDDPIVDVMQLKQFDVLDAWKLGELPTCHQILHLHNSLQWATDMNLATKSAGSLTSSSARQYKGSFQSV